MSYNITVRIGTGIKQINLQIQGGLHEIVRDNITNIYTFTSIEEGHELRFTAIMMDGYVLDQWVYSIGNTSYNSTNNPLVFDDGASGDIDIQATGFIPWELSEKTLSQISLQQIYQIYLDDRQIYRYKISFKYPGQAKFYTTGALDTCVYLTTGTQWNMVNGEPITSEFNGYLAWDDDSGDGTNFKIVQNVKTDTTYYLWVRGNRETTSGNTTLYIDAPSQYGQYTITLNTPSHTKIPVIIGTTTAYFQLYVLDADNNRVGLALRSVNYGELSNMTWTLSEVALDKNKSYRIRGDFFSQCPDPIFGADGVKQTVYAEPFDTNSEYFITSCYTDYFIITEDPKWTVRNFTYTFVNLEEEKMAIATTSSLYQLLSCTVSFINDGKATFWSESRDGYAPFAVNGYLSSSNNYNELRGEPSSLLSVDEYIFDGTNFKFSYNVKAGVTYYFWAKHIDGKSKGSCYIYVSPPGEDADKPQVFNWSFPINPGDPFVLTAQEWNDFTSRINEVRVYKKNTEYPFTEAEAGQPFKATMYNEIRPSLQEMNSTFGYSISEVSPKQIITGEAMMVLTAELNTIIENL